MRAQRTSEQWPAGNHLTALTLNFVNRAERAIKPFVIGRKNWMFSPTANGVQASANLYNIIETAKANGLVLFDYMIKCLDELCQLAHDIESLLPSNFKP